jgi:hypothetical protein
MGVMIYGRDQDGRIVLRSHGGPYGVDGTSVPAGAASTRTDNYTQQFDATEASKVTDLEISLFHPDRALFERIADKGAEVNRSFWEALDNFCRENPDRCKSSK